MFFYFWLWFWPIPPSNEFSVVNTQISQSGTTWFIGWTIEYHGSVPPKITSQNVTIIYDGWVSNSHIRAHAIPRPIEPIIISGNDVKLAKIIDHSNERLRCRERVATIVGPLDNSEERMVWLGLYEKFLVTDARLLDSNNRFYLIVKLEHDHFFVGNYNVLLGVRNFRIFIQGQPLPPQTLDLTIDEEFIRRKPIELSSAPKERRDTRQFHSPPDSIYLAADIPGFQYWRFDDIDAPQNTILKVSFWYLIAIGSEGNCRARIMEYQDTPNAWYRLEGGFDEILPVQGEWQYFEKTFTTLRNTTTIALDFRIVGSNIGELWIDDAMIASNKKPRRP